MPSILNNNQNRIVPFHCYADKSKLNFALIDDKPI